MREDRAGGLGCKGGVAGASGLWGHGEACFVAFVSMVIACLRSV